VLPPIHHDRNHGQHIGETLSVLLKVDDFKLDLPPLFESLLHFSDSFLLDIAAGRPGLNLSAWGLEEPAVVASDLVKGVAGHVGEGRRSVDDGVIWQCHVAENEGAGVVDGAEIYPGVWSEADGSLGNISKPSACVERGRSGEPESPSDYILLGRTGHCRRGPSASRQSRCLGVATIAPPCEQET
jgi:hypothetical protein